MSEGIGDKVTTVGGAVARVVEDRGQTNQWMGEQCERWMFAEELWTGTACR